ncbi:MAG TPA: YceI family protein [Candidatus Eisenbacteria bacterium]|nr:YceI family protein [Candidatus Eisenbacteria bacterium]
MQTKSLLTSALVAAALTLSATAQAATWTIDPAHSSVGFSIRHIFSKVPGGFDKFSGTIEYDPANPTAASVKVDIDPASINTKTAQRDNHLRSADFFDVATYPTMSFVSTKVTKGEGNALSVEGNLTMHGVTKPVTLAATFLGAGPAQPGSKAGFEATATIDRKQFGIIWNKAIDNGTLLGDDVTINIGIEAYIPGEKK